MDIFEFAQQWLRGLQSEIKQAVAGTTEIQGLMAALATDLKGQIATLTEKMEVAMATLQEQLDTLTGAVAAGVSELRDEIARLAALPAGEPVDFTALQGIADALAGDNIPAAPPVEPPVEEPPVEPAP